VESSLGDLEVQDADEVESVTEAARNMADSVPDHVADEIEADVDAIARQLEAMVDAEGDSDLLEELNAEDSYVRAQTNLALFNDENCDE